MENEATNNSKSRLDSLISEVLDDKPLLDYMKYYNKSIAEGIIEENKVFEEHGEVYIEILKEKAERRCKKALGKLDELELYIKSLEEKNKIDPKIEEAEYEDIQGIIYLPEDEPRLSTEENRKGRIITGVKNLGIEAKKIYRELNSTILRNKTEREKARLEKKAEKSQRKEERKVKRNEIKEGIEEKIQNSLVIKGAKTFGRGVKTVAKGTLNATKDAIETGIDEFKNLHDEATKRYEERKTQTIQTALGFVNSVSKHLQEKLNEKILTPEEKTGYRKYRTVSPEVVKRVQGEQEL